jgi:hypothetical protein
MKNCLTPLAIREMQIKITLRPGMVAHICNPSYLKGRDWEDHKFRPTLAPDWLSSISTNGWVN